VSDREQPAVEREETLRAAVETWGEDLQIALAIEELSELTTELARVQRGRGVLDDYVDGLRSWKGGHDG